MTVPVDIMGLASRYGKSLGQNMSLGAVNVVARCLDL